MSGVIGYWRITFCSMSAAASVPDRTDPVAALRFLAVACGQSRETVLSDEEAHGLEVILNLIADQVEGETT